MRYRSAYCWLLTFALLLLPGCSAPQQPDKEGPVTLFVTSDIHFLDPGLIADMDEFEKMCRNGDGKMTHIAPELTDALIEETLAARPDALILSGDLTYNGERDSHRELARRLEVLPENGIPVYVIPGNHDVNNPASRSFDGKEFEPVRNVSAKGFARNYQKLGYGSALYRDKESLSYIAPISKDVWLAMLDTCDYEESEGWQPDDSSIAASTLAWLETCLEAAKQQGVTVVSVTHYSLIDQNRALRHSYTIRNNDALLALYAKYGIRLNLSGHIHAQHIQHDSPPEGQPPIYDIASSSLAVYTNQYGILDFVPGKSYDYRTKELDMEAWAQRNDPDNRKLLGFSDYSYDFFYQGAYSREYIALGGWKDLTKHQREQMAQTMALLNPHYFSGTIPLIRETLLSSEGYRLWQTRDDSLREYITSALEETYDSTRLHIPIE